ncbi:MAG: hypothetical protein M1834_008919 [Cirrosporium novae-zelandiae]|nr:MAG: hypothetical protein M1834_008919 [Cirrosporium novae-zelandiae]
MADFAGLEGGNDGIPAIVIGIDFGMTQTAVAYSRARDWSHPKPIQHWPGKLVYETVNKVPTAIAYYGNSRNIKTWGFLCEPIQDDEEFDIKELFKLHLDPQYRDEDAGHMSTKDARRAFEDYISCIHSHIEKFFDDRFSEWRYQVVEFIFSVPTTWKSAGMMNDLEDIIERAGFGGDGDMHRFNIGLTEAEAAAVYVSNQQLQKDDVMLVCDAGGGTTDVNVLKVISLPENPTRLKQLIWVEVGRCVGTEMYKGRPIGSAFINMRVTKLIMKQLKTIPNFLHTEEELRECAEKMMQGPFERFKCSFGDPASNVPTLFLPIPGLSPECDYLDLGIRNSKLMINREDLERIFDGLVKKMINLINEQIEKMEKIHPSEKITHLVVSGGLGSSEYVRKQLNSYYKLETKWPNTQNMRIILAEQPQLAVVNGLVMSRVQEINQNTVVFDERCSRMSYGVICREPYDRLRHIGDDVICDPRDRKMWANDQIDWFIKQGQSISIHGICKPYGLKIAAGEEGRPRKFALVTSELQRDQLPRSLKQNGVRSLCDIEYKLKGSIGMKPRNRHWYNRGQKYIFAEFNIRVILGPADIKFQLETKEGEVCNKPHQAVEVTWDPPIAASGDSDFDDTPMEMGYATRSS